MVERQILLGALSIELSVHLFARHLTNGFHCEVFSDCLEKRINQRVRIHIPIYTFKAALIYPSQMQHIRNHWVPVGVELPF